MTTKRMLAPRLYEGGKPMVLEQGSAISYRLR